MNVLRVLFLEFIDIKRLISNHLVPSIFFPDFVFALHYPLREKKNEMIEYLFILPCVCLIWFKRRAGKQILGDF